MSNIILPNSLGKSETYQLLHRELNMESTGPFNRIAFAAAHMVVKPLNSNNPWLKSSEIDWDRTLAYREYLWHLGFGVAEAMDTAQRGMGIDWPCAAELIERSCALSKTISGARIACGGGTDQLMVDQAKTLDDVVDAYLEQIEVIERAGGQVIIMASRQLAAIARGPSDYLEVYEKVIKQCSGKIILHWLGEMFDPSLAGYWGSGDIPSAMNTVLQLMMDHSDSIEGIKISLLEQKWEEDLRQRLPDGIVMFTGDDFNYPDLVAGDEKRHSHALLGIFDAIAPVASAALSALQQGDRDQYFALMNPTIALSREIFCAPTQFYKAGLVFLAWLNGHQDHFVMAGGLQSSRGIMHYAEIFRLADQAGLLLKPDLAVARMKSLLTCHGIS